MLRKWGRLFLLLGLAIQISGCTGAALLAGGAAGATGVVYVRGKLQEQFSVPLTKVHEATLASLKEFELPIKEDKKDRLAAKVRSQLADGDLVFIDIHSLAESSTRITIRVGIFGDESRSRRLLERIRRRLG